MQEQGVRPDDPEFIKAQRLLVAVQRQQAFNKQRHAAQQQQLNGADAPTNGAHGKLVATLPSSRVRLRVSKLIHVSQPALRQIPPPPAALQMRLVPVNLRPPE